MLPSIHEPRANTNIPASRPQARGIILRGLSWSVPHPSTRTGTGTFRSMLLAYRGRRIWSPERDKSPTPSRLVPWPISCPRDGPENESFYLSTNIHCCFMFRGRIQDRRSSPHSKDDEICMCLDHRRGMDIQRRMGRSTVWVVRFIVKGRDTEAVCAMTSTPLTASSNAPSW